MAHDVFISHSTIDRAVANAVCARLEQHNIRCWIAPRDEVAGSDWRGAIHQAIQSSRVMVVILSANAIKSGDVLREIGQADRRHIEIVPLRIEDVHLTGQFDYLLSSLHWLDALTPPLEDHLEKLVRAVQSKLCGAAEAGLTKSETNEITFSRAVEDPKLLLKRQFGSYVLDAYIGRGGSGLVYRAQNPRLGQSLCLKLLYPLPSQSANRNISTAISRGMRALASIHDRRIGQVYDFGEAHLDDAPSIYIARELVKGKDLKAWSRPAKETLAVKDQVQMAFSLTMALKAAHTCKYFDELRCEQTGILHGDLMPSNIFVREDGSPVVVDFLMPRVHPMLDSDGVRPAGPTECAVFGTPGFMAPEQELDGHLTVRSDLYSLGKTFCTIFGDPSESNSNSSGELAALEPLIARMLAEDPQDRPRDTAEVAEFLARVAVEMGFSLVG